MRAVVLILRWGLDTGPALTCVNGISHAGRFAGRHCKVREGETPRGGHVVSKDRDTRLVRMPNWVELMDRVDVISKMTWVNLKVTRSPQ